MQDKMGRVIQSITQQLLAGGIFYIKQKLHVLANRGHHQVLSNWTIKTECIFNSVRNCVSTVRSQHLLRVGLVYLNLNPGYRGSNPLDIVRRTAGGYAAFCGWRYRCGLVDILEFNPPACLFSLCQFSSTLLNFSFLKYNVEQKSLDSLCSTTERLNIQ